MFAVMVLSFVNWSLGMAMYDMAGAATSLAIKLPASAPKS